MNNEQRISLNSHYTHEEELATRRATFASQNGNVWEYENETKKALYFKTKRLNLY